MKIHKPAARLLMMLACCLMTGNLFAQKAYLAVHTGYALPVGKQSLAGISFSNYTSDVGGTTSRQTA